MSNLININSKGKVVALEARRFRIYLVGVWGIKLCDFSLTLKHKETNAIINCERAFWPVQAYAFGKRAKRILTLDVIDRG